MNKPRVAVVIGLILAAAASRLAPHPPNFAPIAALALFGGAQFADRRLAFLVPLAPLLLSDLAMGGWWYDGAAAVVYAAFAMIVGIGLWIRHRRTLAFIAAGTLSASILFFIVTNFGVWAFSSLYPKTLAGLAECYVAAIPFFGNTVLGDIAYATVLFGGLALVERRFPTLREAPLPSPAQ